MIRFPILADLPTTPFSGAEVVQGVEPSSSDGDGPGRVRVEVDGKPDVLAFYGAAPEGAPADPLIFLRGDAVEKRGNEVVANEWYVATTAYDVQALTEQLSASFVRPYIHLARPGILGSSGHHLDRRRPREIALVDAALTRLKAHFGWRRLNLVGQSGGGHLVAALIARRADIGCAVISSGNTAVAQRNRENGWTADITGHTDFLDPIDHVAEVAHHPPKKIIVSDRPERPACVGVGPNRLCRGVAPGRRREWTIASCRHRANSGMTCNCQEFWQPSPGWRTIAKPDRTEQAGGCKSYPPPASLEHSELRPWEGR